MQFKWLQYLRFGISFLWPADQHYASGSPHTSERQFRYAEHVRLCTMYVPCSYSTYFFFSLFLFLCNARKSHHPYFRGSLARNFHLLTCQSPIPHTDNYWPQKWIPCPYIRGGYCVVILIRSERLLLRRRWRASCVSTSFFRTRRMLIGVFG
ncbi:hypothetical protein P167DRAFT_26838 [Morchella conica CCBAS932]|uniref:Uncharacterized protein n=1 Tax=Morchella conica CCBAS932 TaxID=1392247 RepID=A0A3N4LA94_9PEZI|nr:hypothetical protein P167DRAFT_26838 [Morchella conica CCBAS932]